ncbi:MAG: T9SS C-terminal target domain-containing protein [Sphingobacteriia bacterium]|nr:T9SS C-terminal target domain-containing protein [Candidatus Fonsibacter lacus]
MWRSRVADNIGFLNFSTFYSIKSAKAAGIYFVEVQNKNSLKTQKLIKW